MMWKVDATTSATKAKTRSTLAKGSYHADNTGEHFRNHLSCKDQSRNRLSKLTKLQTLLKFQLQ